ncbi:hypothetical protein CsSME_00003007 [Camellia sinensis var. sinensis]
MNVGNRRPCELSMTRYKNVAKKFLKKTSLLHSAKQMKNKYDNLKKDWIVWKKLQDANQGFTGLGYDQATGLFTEPDHWWAKMQAMNNRCAKFKTKPLQHLALMERVYSDAAVTGKHAWTPIEIYDENVDATNTVAYSGMGPLSAGTPPHPRHDIVEENVVDSSLFDDASPYSNVDESTNAKCRKRPGPDTVASSINNLVEAVSKQNRELKITQYVVTEKGENIVNDCLARLMDTLGLEPNGQLLSFAYSIMDSPDNCDIMMALPLDYVMN